MRLGINLPYQGAAEMAQYAERLGYDLALPSEGLRCDGATVHGWVAARTERIDVASAVFQMPARTPVMTELTAATLDDRIAARMAADAEAGITTLAISALVPALEGRIQTIRAAARALDWSGAGDGHACARVIRTSR